MRKNGLCLVCLIFTLCQKHILSLVLKQHEVFYCNPSAIIYIVTCQLNRKKYLWLAHHLLEILCLGRKALHTRILFSSTGRYECVSTKNSLPFIRWERIESINPFPDIQISRDKRFQCVVGETVSLQCCVSSIYQVEMVKVSDGNSHLQEPGEMTHSKADYNKCIIIITS